MEQMNTELPNERKPYRAPARMAVLGQIDAAVLTGNSNGSENDYEGNESAS